MDFVTSQRVATLLTQLKNDQEGQPTGLQTSLGFLTDTMTAWTHFADLQRYHDLVTKADRSPAEDAHMQKMAQQPFFPTASAPGVS